MRLLADENIPSASVRRLRDAGHEVIAATEVLRGRPDADLLERAVELDAILVTFDRDFGALVFQLDCIPPKGIILLRFVPAIPVESAEILLSIFEKSDLELQGHLTVVEEERLRQRALPRA